MKILLVFLFCFFTTFIFGQSVGSKVKIPAADGKEYTGVIKEISGNKFKVKYDGFDFEAWLLASQFTVITKDPGGNKIITNDPGGNKVAQNTKYKVGDKIIAKDNVNNWLEAEIMQIAGGKYKVHYAGYSDLWDAWIPEDWIKPSGAKTPATTNPDTKTGLDPEMNGSIPKIIGTAWDVLMIYDKGTPPPQNNHVHTPYIFFKNGTYEYQNNYFTKGKYRVSGNKLTQVSDGADQLTETYTITWNANAKYMELTSSTTVLRLTYNRKTSE